MKVKKILTSLLITLIMISLSAVCFAKGVNLDDYNGTDNPLSNSAEKIANQIIGVVQVIAVSAAVILLIYLAVKYIMASPGEKADIKKSATIYIIGAVLLFATTGILQIIRTFALTVK